MTVRDTLVKEIDSLPESQQADVLTYVRFLKIGLGEPEQIEARFAEALEELRQQAEQRGLSAAEVEAEIQAVRARQ